MKHRLFTQIINAFLIGIFFFTTSVPQALAGEKVYFYHNDPSGTPIAMTDDSGAVVWEADYLPFGEEYDLTADIDNNKMFVGKEKDKETGLYYFGARYMEPKIGRFISPDPVGPVDPWTGEINQALLVNPQRLNPYAYALNNPYRYVDPDGEFAILTATLTLYGLTEAFIWATSSVIVLAGTQSLWDNQIEPMLNENTADDSEASDDANQNSEGKKHSLGRQALNDLIDKATNGGRKPLSNDDADTILDWGDELGIPGVRDDRAEDHWLDGRPHIHVPDSGQPHITTEGGGAGE